MPLERFGTCKERDHHWILASLTRDHISVYGKSVSVALDAIK
jgi:hypothetical protein